VTGLRVAIVSPHPVHTADSGDRIRSLQLAQALRDGGVDVHVLAYAWDAESPPDATTHYTAGRPAGGLARLAWRARLGWSRRTDPFAIHRTPGLHDRMRALVDEVAPDVVDFQHSFTWFATGRPSVVTIHNVDSQRFAGFASVSRRQYDTAVHTEKAAARNADAVVVFSELDAQRLAAHAAPRALHVVPLGSDPGEPLPPPRAELTTIAYVGSFDYAPNVEAVRLLRGQWDAISAATGVRRLLVVGRRAAEHFRTDGEMEVRSDVPSVRAALVDADALVVPLVAGGGVRVKIIEAFRLGLPVVSTALGIEGLGAVDGVHAAVAADVAGLPAALARIGPVEVRSAMADAARDLWDRSFSPRHMAERMTLVYRSVLP
jgi:glycosyltransferase involved in cell wall biosynthesis